MSINRFTVNVSNEDIALGLNKMCLVEMESKSLVVSKALRMYLIDRGFLSKEGKYIANNKQA